MDANSFCLFFVLKGGHRAATKTPDATLNAPGGKLVEEMIGVLLEVCMYDLDNLFMRRVLLGQLFPSQAVDFLDVVVLEALFDDFGADEACRAAKQNSHDCDDQEWCEVCLKMRLEGKDGGLWSSRACLTLRLTCGPSYQRELTMIPMYIQLTNLSVAVVCERCECRLLVQDT